MPDNTSTYLNQASAESPAVTGIASSNVTRHHTRMPKPEYNIVAPEELLHAYTKRE